MLDTMPAEIIAMTAFYACTDGGLTGCSLARVSHHVRHTTRVARFYTVTLAEDPPQVEDFLACYRSEVSRVPDSRPPVRHLFLSLFSRHASTAFRSEQIQSPSEMPQAAPSARDRLAQWVKLLRDQEDCTAQYALVLPDLLKAVAPDLHKLALLQTHLRNLLPTVIVEFPALEELILVGGDPKFQRFDKLEDASQPPLYPSLRRLHHLLHWQGPKDGVDFEAWSRHAPNLTHLRVSRLHLDHPGTIDTLIRAYGKIPDEQVLFPHLESVLIQPLEAPEGYATRIRERLNATIARTGVNMTILENWVDWTNGTIACSEVQAAGQADSRHPESDLWSKYMEGRGFAHDVPAQLPGFSFLLGGLAVATSWLGDIAAIGEYVELHDHSIEDRDGGAAA